MITFTPEQLEKLPKWAQERARVMNLENARMADEVAALTARFANEQGEPTRVKVAYRRMQNIHELYLDEHDAVEFTLAEKGKKFPGVRVNANRDFTELRVNADGAIAVIPSASNSILIRVLP